ncbi:ricin-type beta-trefoil lectin domain protein, partial [Roseisolibacter sp. H3M3-2]|uniref:ricin-type beta-trefoil lectin domain protein n=1 Tax=Roseisolibacter sp. H3M3-2 TaxID=3031323 RepID=UPI0023DA4527
QPSYGAIVGGNTVTTAACASGVATQQWATAAVGSAGEASPGGSHCLDALGGSAGTTLAILYCQGTASQRWTVTAAGELRSAGGLCATFVAAGAPVVLRGCDGSAAQRWTGGSSAPAPTPTPTVPGTLPSATGQGCLQPSYGAIVGGNTVTTAACASGVPTQQWATAAVGSAGEASPGGSHCLDALGGSAGTTLAILYCQGTASQRWTLTAAGELRSANGLCA